MTNIAVVEGDITKIQSDALITTINIYGEWYGAIDRAIMRVAGPIFHMQAADASPLHDGQTIVARPGRKGHDGAFSNVVFVVDDLQKPLSVIIFIGLVASSKANFKSVTLPIIRMGVMRGEVEGSPEESIDEMAKGIQAYLAETKDNSLEKITFVVYQDTQTYDELRIAIQSVLY